MRVAVNTRFLLKGRLEGLGWHNYEICKRLVTKYQDDTFIFFFDRPYDSSFIWAPNVIPVVVPPPARHPVLWYMWFEWAIPYFLRKYKADVFLSPDSYCSLRSGVPTVMVTHDIAHVHYPEQVPKLVSRYYDYFVPKFLDRADRIITVSDFVRHDIVQQYHIQIQKIDVAANGLRGRFSPLSEKEKQAVRNQYASGEPYFFYLGAVHPRKNVDRLISAFDQFKLQTKSKVKLLIGGRMAWQTGKIRAAYDAARYRDDIIFLGYMSNEAVESILAGALALTYVSLLEGFGLPILEAMHAEVPIITSDRSSMPEVAGSAAILVNPESIGDIVDAMKELYNDPQLQKRLVAAGKQQRDLFSWDKSAETIYQSLLEVMQK